MKLKLYDGSECITHISILCMFKNNEDYLNKFFFNAMNLFEETYDVHFNYFIHENNSKDSTKQLLKEFILTKSKCSQLVMYDLESEYKNIGNGKNYDRISNLAKIRNKLVEMSRPFETKWNILIDSNIFFEKSILTKMFACKPTESNIGILTPYTQQLLIPGIHIDSSNKGPALKGHYFDTFSYFDTNSKTYWPYCPFEKCEICAENVLSNTKHRSIIPRTKDIVDVTSAHGGFSIIHKDILNNLRIKWNTCSHDSTKDESLCEHFLFCFMAKQITGKRVVLLQNVDTIYRTY